MKLDVTTHWNSTFEILDSTIDLRPAICHYAERDSAYVWLPSEDDWSRAESVRKFLAIFYNSTKKFSGYKYPIANIFFLELWKVKDALRKSSSGQDFLRFMTMGMQIKFDKYWSECSLVMGVGVILDLRYKMIMVDFICNKLYGLMGVGEAEKISGAASELYNLYVCAAKEQSPHVGSSSAVDESQEDMTDDFMSYYAQVKGTQVRSQTHRSKLEEYLKDDLLVLNKGDEFDVLEWWRARSGKLQYPVLSLMARDILSIPISTVALESAFSTGSRVISKYRISLTPKLVEALICTQDWLHPMWGKETSIHEEFDEEESVKIEETV
ncbi:zinc finger BED domain-containing protein RICESLEEPER 1-like [Magnolia sinica]|uniref:zinc finger BED domain-containing protein RICESLEEPER 1-like n=1 Tax=Magnolia sinica TaxID=86752 RepID=UPI00265AA7CB|nr:zinc finger BED domain-containing protein RICESLEEPER 1-like [Magnolia sinica]